MHSVILSSVWGNGTTTEASNADATTFTTSITGACCPSESVNPVGGPTSDGICHNPQTLVSSAISGSGGGGTPPGDDSSAHGDFDPIYSRLKKLGQRFVTQWKGHSFAGGTDLAHEALKALWRPEYTTLPKTEFVKIASATMINILRGRYRLLLAITHNGERSRIPLGDDVAATTVEQTNEDGPHIAAAMESLQAEWPLQAQVLHLVVFCDLTIPQIAALLGITVSKAEHLIKDARHNFRIYFRRAQRG